MRILNREDEDPDLKFLIQIPLSGRVYADDEDEDDEDRKLRILKSWESLVDHMLSTFGALLNT
eukprot:984114-Heterocapsa_arctica.AAC.1